MDRPPPVANTPRAVGGEAPSPGMLRSIFAACWAWLGGGGRSYVPFLIPGLVLVLLWGLVIYQMYPQWSLYSHYAYGRFIPLLCLFHFWRHWPVRPESLAASINTPPSLFRTPGAAVHFPGFRCAAVANPVAASGQSRLADDLLGFGFGGSRNHSLRAGSAGWMVVGPLLPVSVLLGSCA